MVASRPFLFIVSVAVFLFSVGLPAQPFLDWAGVIEYERDLFILDLEMQEGNLRIAGEMSGVADFDPSPGVFTLGHKTLGLSGYFSATYDSTGKLIWPVGWDASSLSYPISLAPLDSGDFVIGGNFRNDLYLEPYPSTAVKLTTKPNEQQLFLAKYGPFGSLQWGFGLPTSKSASFKKSRIDDLVSDNENNLYLLGMSNDEIDLDPGPNKNIFGTKDSVGQFVAKYDTDGAFKWAVEIINSYYALAGDITIDNGSNLCYRGQFGTDTVVVIDKSGRTIKLFPEILNTGSSYLVSVDSAGNYRYSLIFNTTVWPCMSPDGSLYAYGMYRDTVDIEPGPGRTMIGKPGGKGAFISKFNQEGDFQWGFSIEGDNKSIDISAFEFDAFGNLYLSGYVFDSVDFDPSSSSYFTKERGVFLAKYDPRGQFLWNTVFSTFRGRFTRIAIDNNNIYMSGRFEDSIDLHTGIDTSSFLYPGEDNAFLAKFNCRSIYDTVFASICSGDEYLFQGEVYSRSGVYAHSYRHATVCDSSVLLFLEVKAEPYVTRMGQKTLKANTSNASYQWVDCDNGYASIAGATSQSFTPSVNGNYAVIVSQGGCSDTSDCMAITSVGAAYSVPTTPVSLYPNPAQSSIRLSFSLDKGSSATISIFSMEGRELIKKQMDTLPVGQQTIRMDVSDLPAGLYHVLLVADNKRAMKKMALIR